MKIAKVHLDRLDLSERVIDGWEAISWPGGSPSELLRLVIQETAVLATLRAEDPERVGQIIERYDCLAKRLRQQLV